MFDVLLESCAASPRRSGGAMVSLVAHVSIVGAVALGAARGVVCRHGFPTLDGRTWRCPEFPVQPPVVRWVKPPDKQTTERGGAVERSDGTPTAPKVPRRMKFDFSPTALDGPVTTIDITNGGVLDPGEWCTRKEDCEISPGPTGRAGTVEGSEITTGSELVARLVGAPARPRYPESLRAAGLGGRVLVQFTVDTTGRVDPQAVRVLESTHELFARAVLEVLPRYRFVPAEAGGRRVRMLAQMPFEFAITKQ